jgi:hypothetical protein
VTVRTDDGIDLAGIVLPAASPASGRPLTFVLAHGFTACVVPGFGHAETGATVPLVERIGRWASATIDA